MTIFVTLDTDNRPTAFFETPKNPLESIPVGAQEISTAMRAEFLENPGIRKLVDGIPVACDPPIIPMSDDQISLEAERRISNGKTISATLVGAGSGILVFRCDERSISRLQRLASAFERGTVAGGSRTYRTLDGISITFTSKTQVDTLLDHLDLFESEILERSEELQSDYSLIVDDISEDENWP
ncbi:MAG: hypothetical protein COA62_15590 [Rhodobiaceae bacterium]|nr:MAG: hypothetical protein COA62_15590 [Rhodobiaceae bacterium]